MICDGQNIGLPSTQFQNSTLAMGDVHPKEVVAVVDVSKQGTALHTGEG